MLDRVTQPAIQPVQEIAFLKPEHVRLSNGINVFGFNVEGQEVVQVELVFQAGERMADKQLLSQYTNKMIGEASVNYTSGTIMDKIDYYGAYLETSSGKDIASVSLFSLEKQMNNVLPIFADAVLNPTFPEQELKVHLSNGQQKFKVQNEKVAFRCRQLFNQKLFDNHAYGRVVDASNYQNIGVEDLKKFYERRYSNVDFFIMVAGNYSSKLYDNLEVHFGAIKGNLNDAKKDKLNQSTAKKIYEEKEGAIQSGIRLGKILNVEFGSQDYFRLKVLNTALGGYFGSRLMSNIREDKGYTYGIGSAISAMNEAVAFFISTEVGADVTNAALNEIYCEVERLRTSLIGEEELEMVKNYMLGSLLKSSDGPFALAERYKAVYLKGKDLDYYNELIQVINEVNAEEIREVAIKFLDPDSFLEVVVGKK